MTIQEIQQAYQHHPAIFAMANEVRKSKGEKYYIDGLAGSQIAVITAALIALIDRPVVIVMNDKEEALYFQADLEQMIEKDRILLFPASYKRPYQPEEIDNANVLRRAEVLNRINHTSGKKPIVITFAEALTEKVVNQRSLVQATQDIAVGHQLDLDFMIEVLENYGYEREDFVYEPGQFAVRGGILDVFSFAHELPYRLDLFGDEVEKIREFDPVSQLTEREVKTISLIPNIQKTLLTEEKVSFLDYIPEDSVVFIKSVEFVRADLDRMYDKAIKTYEGIQEKSGGAATSRSPEELYVNGDLLVSELRLLSAVEFGRKRFLGKAVPVRKDFTELEEEQRFNQGILYWKGSGQPSFKKEFKLLAEHFSQQSELGYSVCVLSSNEKQLKRLKEIFEEIAEDVHFQGVKAELHEGFQDPILHIDIYTDHQIFQRYHAYKSTTAKQRSQAITLKELQSLNPRDYVTHVSHGIGQFAGLHTIKVGEQIKEVAKIIYQGGDAIFVDVNQLHKIAKYTGKDGDAPKLSKIGGTAWTRAKAKTKKRIKELAFDLVDLYAKRKAMKRTPFAPDGYMQTELEASFMYEDTPDQVKTTEDVKGDMEREFPMDRLVCGDVGFGKTEIAIRAAFKAAVNGKQTAILAPTTILTLQHYRTFRDRLAEFPVRVDYLNRFKSTKDSKETLAKLAAGEIDILIGTHRLVSKDVKFKNLGLMIIDEEQKFGVNVKDKLKAMKASVDSLTLTATPIPRTLQFSLLGIRDLSVIQTPPPNRQPVETVVVTGFNGEVVRDAVAYELKRGGQVYFIHPRVSDIEEIGSSIKQLVPDARIGFAHGQMTGAKLEKSMAAFIEHAYDVLVATKIVESGLDISNANTIIIHQAEKFGLSELHQMRGRVGRSNKKAFCYLLAPHEMVLSDDSRKRLKAMEEFSDLGSGFHIALRDLDIRGAGDLLGPEQSGFIAEIGYDVYHKILDEAVRELKSEHFGDLFEEEIRQQQAVLVDDCHIDMEVDMRIPQSYLPNTAERLNFYRQIAEAMEEKERRDLMKRMIDRFGPMPPDVLHLFDATRIRSIAVKIGLEKVVLKANQLRLYFVSDKESVFYRSSRFQRLIEYITTYSARVQLKESDKYLSIRYMKPVKGIKDVLDLIEELRDFMAKEIPVEAEG
ncbi:MAG: transcription-repair coupling factor [Bacteroidia bacterium]